MRTETVSTGPAGVEPTFERAIKHNRRWYRVQGILFIIAGILALVVPAASIIALEILLAALLIVSGAYQTYQGATDRSGWLLLSGVLSLAVGLVMVFMPLAGAVALATIVAFFLLIEGIIEVIFSFQIRFSPSWKWLLISGILSTILGILLLIGWPGQTLILAGILLGVNFLFYGASMLAIAHGKTA